MRRVTWDQSLNLPATTWTASSITGVCSLQDLQAREAQQSTKPIVTVTTVSQPPHLPENQHVVGSGGGSTPGPPSPAGLTAGRPRRRAQSGALANASRAARFSAGRSDLAGLRAGRPSPAPLPSAPATFPAQG